MEELGRVKALTNRGAAVEIKITPLCKGCGKKGGCAIFNKKTKEEIEALNPLSAKVGDLVKIDFEKNRLRLALLFFGLPSIFLLTAITIGAHFFSERIILLLVIGSLTVFFLVLKFLNNYLSKKGSFLPIITEIVAGQKTFEE